MLILSRYEGERIIINHDIVIEIVEIIGKKARIGISAPQEVKISRAETYERFNGEPPPEPTFGATPRKPVLPSRGEP